MASQNMEPHWQSRWYLHEIPFYAKASEGYPQLATSAVATILHFWTIIHAFIYGRSPWFSA